MPKSLRSKIIEILTPPNPPEAKFHGGVEDWEYKYNKAGMEFIVAQILELFAHQTPPQITGDWEKELEPWVSKPNREGEEQLYEIKKTIAEEIWAKQKPKIRQLLAQERNKMAEEIDEILRKQMIEFANASIKNRRNGFDELFEARQRIQTIKGRESIK